MNRFYSFLLVLLCVLPTPHTTVAQHLDHATVFSTSISQQVQTTWLSPTIGPAVVKASLVTAGIGAYLFIRTMKVKNNLPTKSTSKLPIVYHERYDITLFWRLERWIHPFDGCKYGKIAARLCQTFNRTPQDAFHRPQSRVSESDLKRVHTSEYLISLNESSIIARIAEIPLLAWIPNRFLQYKILDPMRYATQGTINAIEIALKEGFAINLSGGYHHARTDGQESGFCFFNDIAIALNVIRTQKTSTQEFRVLIVDCDAHRGNGVMQTRKEDDLEIYIFDMYSESNYPYHLDLAHKRDSDLLIPLVNGIQDTEYLKQLTEKLPAIIEKINPQLIIYNAGTDVYEGDRLGHMKISAAGIIKRDAYVVGQAHSRNIPIAMVLSGGYSAESADIVADSIENLLRAYL